MKRQTFNGIVLFFYVMLALFIAAIVIERVATPIGQIMSDNICDRLAVLEVREEHNSEKIKNQGEDIEAINSTLGDIKNILLKIKWGVSGALAILVFDQFGIETALKIIT